MHSNNAHAFNDDGIVSSSSNASTVKSESLDRLFKEQLADLRNLAINKAQQNDIEICRKWLKVFKSISNSEKMARNCLCALMREQLQECGFLKEPFTNLRNCKRNLESVLNELDELLSSDLYNQSYSSQTNDTFKSHGLEEAFKQQRPLDMILSENRDVLLNIEAAKLTSELQSLRLQLAEKEMEIHKLKEIAEKCTNESRCFEETFRVARNSILDNIKELILEMQQRGIMGMPLNFFRYMFTHFPHKDKEFDDTISKYDEDLQNVFHKQFKCDFDKRKSLITRYICRKFAKSKTKLQKKYERRLNAQTESHKLQLKLAKLKSFSILRQIFIDFHDKFDQLEGWEILKALEDKYQTVVNGEM